MENALKVSGTLIVPELFQLEGLFDKVVNTLAIPIRMALRLINNGRLSLVSELKEAWLEHTGHDHYLTLAQIRGLCKERLPQARIKQQLLWRYSLIWHKLA